MPEVRLLNIGEVEPHVFTRWDITGHQVNRHLLSKALIHHMHRHSNADMFIMPLSGAVQFVSASGASVEQGSSA